VGVEHALFKEVAVFGLLVAEFLHAAVAVRVGIGVFVGVVVEGYEIAK